MVYAHGIIGSYRTIDKTPFGFSVILFPTFFENAVLFPEFQDIMLCRNEINFGIYFFNAHDIGKILIKM
jgi:hypothetical protein